MADWPRRQSSSRFDWPRFLCGAIDVRTSTLCGERATWKERPIAGSDLWWLRCDGHRGETAEPIAQDERFTVTRLELRVAVATIGGDRVAAAIAASRLIQNAVTDAGGVVVATRVPGELASEPDSQAALGRLSLAGPAEGGQQGDRPFWGTVGGRDGYPWRRRRKA